MTSIYAVPVKYGIISGLIVLIIYVVTFGMMSFVSSMTERPATIVDGKKLPTPTSDNWEEIFATIISFASMVIIAVLTGAVAARKIIGKDTNSINTLVVSAITGMVSFFIVTTVNNIYLYIKSVSWYINDYGLVSAMSHSAWVADGYIYSLPLMVIIGALLSAVGGFLYFIYAGKKKSLVV